MHPLGEGGEQEEEAVRPREEEDREEDRREPGREGDAEVIEGEGGEEGQEADQVRIYDRPSLEEYEQHCVTHVPFRPWCDHCVIGRGEAGGHYRRRVDDHRDPTVHMDYMFLTGRGDGEEDQGMPTIVWKDDRTKIIKARLVPEKGASAYAVKRIAKDMKLLGYHKFIMKSDGEPAIVRLKEAVKGEMEQTIVLEESPVGDSQSNGIAERAIKTVQGMIRTLKSALEKRIGEEVMSDHPVLPWMITHAAELVNRYQKGKDGRTAHYRWKGKVFKKKVVEFGEVVLYLIEGKRGAGKRGERGRRHKLEKR